MESNFFNDTNERIYNTETDSSILKPNYGFQRRNMVERDKLGVWDYHTQTTVYKIGYKDMLYSTGTIANIL